MAEETAVAEKISSFHDLKVPDNVPESPAQEETKVEETKDKQEEPVKGKIKIGEEELEEEVIKSALESHKHRKDWEKSNTEKAQEIATARNALKPMLAFIDKLKAKGEDIEDIKSAFDETYGDEFKGVFDELIKIDLKEFKDPRDEEIAMLKAEKAERENEKALNDEKKELAAKFKLKDEQAEEVLQFAIKNFDESGQALTLEQAYKQINYDKAIEAQKAAEEEAKRIKEEKKQPEPPKDVKAGTGAKNFVDGRRIRSYKDLPGPS